MKPFDLNTAVANETLVVIKHHQKTDVFVFMGLAYDEDHDSPSFGYFRRQVDTGSLPTLFRIGLSAVSLYEEPTPAPTEPDPADLLHWFINLQERLTELNAAPFTANDPDSVFDSLTLLLDRYAKLSVLFDHIEDVRRFDEVDL